VSALSFRALALWLLGYPDAAVADSDRAIQEAREFGHAPTLMYTLGHATMHTRIPCEITRGRAELDELAALAEEKGASFWKAFGTLIQGCLLVLDGKASEAIETFTQGLAAYASTGATVWQPVHLSFLARAYAELNLFDDARRSMVEAMTTLERTGETWYEPEIHRMAGELVLKEPQPDAAKAEAHFERAMAIARQQQAKSFELRAVMSMARLWRNQRKHDKARDLLAPVYCWFTEGFDTPDLREAKALLAELASAS
jgi:predicted ATPase